MTGDRAGSEEHADVNESKRRFFSGATVQQALVQAANHFHLQPEEVAFQPIEKRHGFTKVRRKVVIEVNPESPKRSAGAVIARTGVGGGAASRPELPTVTVHPEVGAFSGEDPTQVDRPSQAASDGVGARPGFSPAAQSAVPALGLGRQAGPSGEGGSEGHATRRGDGQGGGRRRGSEASHESRRGFGNDRGRARVPSGAFPRDRRPLAGAGGGPEAAPEDLVALPEQPRSVAERYPRAEGPQAEAAAQGVELVLRIAGLDLTPRIYRSEERLEIDLVGGDTDWCFADDGELLMAIEHLLPRIIRSLSGEAVLCRVDCDNFHEIREERLRSLAQKVADEVRQKGRPRTLVPMNPADRRIIHVTLADDPAVATESEGDGYFKRITVKPT
jgi:predicted RNA-binding protein Jag